MLFKQNKKQNSILAVFKALGRINMDWDIFKYFLEEIESELCGSTLIHPCPLA